MTSSFPLSFPRPEQAVFVLNEDTIRKGLLASRESPRRRIILPVHRSGTEGVQRMLNFMQRGSYARPHCHPAAENIETVVAIQGVVGFLVFDAAGGVLAAHRLEAGRAASCMVDIEAGVWHTVVPLADDCVILEVKRGPYNAATDKTFAAWAPAEGSAEAPDYLRQLEAAFDTAP